jgi:hypothetical protein
VEGLIKCNGQDLIRKAAKANKKIMMVLPSQLSVPAGFEGVIGQLENLNSDCPSFVMHSAKVWHFMTKKYISDHRHCVAGHVTVSGAISGDHNKLLVNIMLSQET